MAKRKTSINREPPDWEINRDELKKAVEYLAFDMYHFRCYTKLYKNPKLGMFCPAAHQAVLYALLVHLRLLVDFFHNKAEKPDDCRLDHFKALPEFRAAFPASTKQDRKWAEKVGRNLSKRLVHFTATRWLKTQPNMKYYEEFGVTIDDLITKFQAALPQDLREVFEVHYRNWERNHPPLTKPPSGGEPL